MTYDEAKRELFAKLVPKTGSVYVAQNTGDDDLEGHKVRIVCVRHSTLYVYIHGKSLLGMPGSHAVPVRRFWAALQRRQLRQVK